MGLTTQEARGAHAAPSSGAPVAGVTADEVLDATASIRDVAARYLGVSTFNLPHQWRCR